MIRPLLAVSLAGLERTANAPWAAGPRAAIDWAAGLGIAGVQIDAMAAGVRPRDLDRSARRDLAALLRRSHLALSGLDLWIPPEHFVDAAKADRALAAALAAIELSADLARLTEGSPTPALSVVLPELLAAEARTAITNQSQTHGVGVADHALKPIMGAGLDPAAILLAGQDPGAAAARAGASLVSARLSDASLTGRVAPGAGRLDEITYLASLSVAGYQRPLVLDLRGVPNQAAAASAVVSRW
jgi:sugar phosphate isomerase/epimerase